MLSVLAILLPRSAIEAYILYSRTRITAVAGYGHNIWLIEEPACIWVVTINDATLEKYLFRFKVNGSSGFIKDQTSSFFLQIAIVLHCRHPLMLELKSTVGWFANPSTATQIIFPPIKSLYRMENTFLPGSIKSNYAICSFLHFAIYFRPWSIKVLFSLSKNDSSALCMDPIMELNHICI
jgi:hypothetical protein